jgi:hypothetical protein
MTRSDGTCKVDGVTLGEVSINLLGHSIELSTKYVLCNSETGDRFGAGNRNTNWSADTIEKLRALVDSMERDIVRDLFTDGATIGSVEDVVQLPPDGVPGL